MKLSALPATRSYWITMLAISQMFWVQVKLESRELEHSSLKQKSWLWLTVFTQDIMVLCYCVSLFFLLLVFSPLSGSLFVVQYILWKKYFTNKYGLNKLLLSLFKVDLLLGLFLSWVSCFSNIKWYYVSYWFSSIPPPILKDRKEMQSWASHFSHDSCTNVLYSLFV